MSTPSIPGVHRDDLADAIRRVTDDWLAAYHAADAALAYIAAHQEPRACDCGSKYDRRPDCTADDAYEEGRKDACDREHADEWVEVDEATWTDLPTRPRPEGEPMSTNENMTVVTDRDRTPDPVATIKPFRHPWIAGDDSCGECGHFFRDHWWADAGDHGHTVCVLPEPADEWVEVDEATWEDLSDGVRVRREWEKGCWVETLRRFVHREDLPDPDEVPVERMARAIFASDCPFNEWEIWDEAVHDRYRRAARAALAAYREEGR